MLRAGENEEMRDIISEYKDIAFKEATIEETPVLDEPTPVFEKF